MHTLLDYQKQIEKGLRQAQFPLEPRDLYDPLRYFFTLGGKRLRPLLLLMSHKAFGGDPAKVIGPALAMEIFHNFTLIHDDIMDEAPIRRGQATVHEKWSPNVGILSGDALMVKAYQELGKAEPKHLPAVLEIFNATALWICEGQQFDMDYEQRKDVTIPEYLRMIRLKTSVLLGSSLKIGAILANADMGSAEQIRHFGECIGMAFQLQDDLLDAFGDHRKVGKQTGGDIVANKKTYLLIRALEKAEADQKKELEDLLTSNPVDKVQQVIQLYHALNIREETCKVIDQYHKEGLKYLEALPLTNNRKAPLLAFAKKLLVREY